MKRRIQVQCHEMTWIRNPDETIKIGNIIN